MSLTKFSHEYKLVDNAYRKLDPIGKMSFNPQVVALKEGNIHYIDLEKSSNFLVKISDVDSWIKFINYDSSSIHRFDVVIEITGNITVNSIKFGDGSKEYHKLQFDPIESQDTILPYIVWPYPIPLRAKDRTLGDTTILTIRYGNHFFVEGEYQKAFAVVSYKWFR